MTFHANIFSPMQTVLQGGNKYFLAITTVEKRYMRVNFFKARSDIIGYFENYTSWLERHLL